MQVNGNQNGAPNYFPNSFNGPTPDLKQAWHTEASTGDVSRYETGDEDNFSQCGQFFRNVLDAGAKDRLTDNIAGNLGNTSPYRLYPIPPIAYTLYLFISPIPYTSPYHIYLIPLPITYTLYLSLSTIPYTIPYRIYLIPLYSSGSARVHSGAGHRQLRQV